jgi:hypothetical protein
MSSLPRQPVEKRLYFTGQAIMMGRWMALEVMA